MDLAYHKYKEIVRNLEEGLKASALSSKFRMCGSLTRSTIISVLQRSLRDPLTIQGHLQAVGKPPSARDEVRIAKWVSSRHRLKSVAFKFTRGHLRIVVPLGRRCGNAHD